jgi:hypothetical protein
MSITSVEERGPTPLSPEDVEHIADIIENKYPNCADQLREHARAMRAGATKSDQR